MKAARPTLKIVRLERFRPREVLPMHQAANRAKPAAIAAPRVQLVQKNPQNAPRVTCVLEDPIHLHQLTELLVTSVHLDFTVQKVKYTMNILTDKIKKKS